MSFKAMDVSPTLQKTYKENNIENEVNIKGSPIVNFYVNKTVFMTGGTGFLGLVLLEKLLYSCEEIECIYILIRNKKGLCAQDRLKKILQSAVFERLYNEKENMFKKIIPIEGDISEPGLGISMKDRGLLQNKVSVVFHVAASVNLDMDIKQAMAINVGGTEELIRLCKEIKLLQALVYVSTAYCNSNRQVIDEKIYPTNCSLKCAYHVANNLHAGSTMWINLLENRPNTYAYTKALAEEMIGNENENIPGVIVRPTIILSAVKEPVRGWVEGMSGGNPIVSQIGYGVLKTWHGEPDSVIDFVPVDYVSNLLIVAAWFTHTRRIAGKKDVKVFNICSGIRNPISVEKFLYICTNYTQKYLFQDAVWYPRFLLTSSTVIFTIHKFIFQIIPAALLDTWAWLFGKTAIQLKIQKRMKKFYEIFKFFSWKQFVFIDRNVCKLYETLSREDRQLFDFNVINYNWIDYLDDYVVGLRKYMSGKRKTKTQ